MFADSIETILALNRLKLYEFNSDIGVNYTKFYKIVSSVFQRRLQRVPRRRRRRRRRQTK
jgi:hypothetical protein